MNCGRPPWTLRATVRDSPDLRPVIYVLAGTNGAGKSSVEGATVRKNGANYFNPDEVARRLVASDPGISLEEANSRAWNEGKRLLERAINEGRNFAFETTLGANTIPDLLQRAGQAGFAIHVWYAGLSSPELHIARVLARVAKGGHDIPESKIRERYDRSRANIIRLLPWLASLRLYDNSAEGDPATEGPRPKLVLSVEEGQVVYVLPMGEVPDWAKPIVLAALG